MGAEMTQGTMLLLTSPQSRPSSSTAPETRSPYTPVTRRATWRVRRARGCRRPKGWTLTRVQTGQDLAGAPNQDHLPAADQDPGQGPAARRARSHLAADESLPELFGTWFAKTMNEQ